MTLHDEYARVTPFEIAFPNRDRLTALDRAVSDEASRRAVDASSLDGFLGLTAVGDFLSELHGAEVPRVALLEYGTLAYHAVQFLRHDMPLFLLATSAARRLVVTVPRAAPEPPARAGYLQLPQHLFWTRPEGAAPESLDGTFWTVSTERTLHLLPVTGIRPDRPGFGTLAVPAAPLGHAADWVEATVRESTNDFATDLPGAQLDRLYAIESVGEMLKLMARFFAHVAESPATVRPAPDATPADAPRPSVLPYRRVGAD
jgi:hypothetical protein